MCPKATPHPLPADICPVQKKLMFKHYQNAAAALGHARKIAATEAVSVPQSMYRCEHCRHWHLTSYTPAETRAIQHAKKRRATA